MRLVCPNCDAEYEVDPAVIPASGREVQCSNCSTSWFQPSPAAEEAAAEEAALFDAPPAAVQSTVADSVTKPRAMDESVIAVLREEAEREAAARRAEASQPIETQPELGLTAAASPAAARIAMMKGTQPEPKTLRRPQTRSEMLPAIEEINSTLRATSVRRTSEPSGVSDSTPATRADASSFRNGFVLVLVVAAIGVVAYVMAPRISLHIPGLAPGMLIYVEAVDGARLWLDAMLRQAIAALRGLSGDQAA